MSMKVFREVLQNMQDYKTANTVNHEGFPAWKREGIERLREILFLGHTGNTFYVGKEENIKAKVRDLEVLILDERIPVDKIANLIVSARNEGLFRTIPILALVLLRKRSPEAFKSTFDKVVLTGNDLKDFLDLNRIVFNGYGRAVKGAIIKWLEKVNPFYALKYRNQIIDGLALARPPVDRMENGLLLKYVYAKRKGIDKETVEKIFSTYPQIEYAERYKLYVEKGDIRNAIEVAEKGKLPADLMIGIAGNTNSPEFWRVVLKNMGVMQFLKFLNKLSGIIPEDVIERLRSITPETLSKAKIFPYRLFVAWKNATNYKIREELERILNLYEKEALIDERWKRYSWAICPDVSGSMTSGIQDGLTPSEVAGFFSSVLAKQLGVKEILSWDTEVYPISTDESLFSLYKRIALAHGGGTAMNTPIDYMIRNYTELPEVVVIITDSEHWASQRGLKTAWRDYKSRNPRAKLVVIEVVGYGTSQVDEEFAKEFDVYTVFGWSEHVFKWIELKVLQ